MIEKTESNDAYQDLLAREQARVGPPPTYDEVQALLDGTLSEEEAERVRGVLACYPDLARIMTTSIEPSAGEGVLTDEQMTADIAAIRRRVHGASPAPIPFPKRRSTGRYIALAAGVAIAVGLGGIMLRRSWLEPRATQTRVLYADGERGGYIRPRGVPAQAPMQLSTDTDYELRLLHHPDHAYREYRVTLSRLTAAAPEVLDSAVEVHREADGSYPFRLSTRGLEPGRYELVLDGVDERPSTEHLATYTLRLTSR